MSIEVMTAEEALAYVKKRKKLLDEIVLMNYELLQLRAKKEKNEQSLRDMDRELRSETPKLVIEK